MELEFCTLTDHGGPGCCLIAVEGGRDIPFEIQRVYYFTGVAAGVRRGGHAHRNLRQVLLCLSGAVTVLLDDGEQRKTVRLSDPTKGLLIGPGLWRELFDFSADAVVLVLADGRYDEADYIRSYNDFVRWVTKC